MSLMLDKEKFNPHKDLLIPCWAMILSYGDSLLIQAISRLICDMLPAYCKNQLCWMASDKLIIGER